jgi:hypothetical protein
MNKKNLKLLAVLVLLAGAAYLYNGPFQKFMVERSKPKNIFADLDADKISRLEISTKTGSTTLERDGSSLKVAGTKGFLVRQDLADSILEDLGKAKDAEMELVSSNMDKKSQFQLDKEGGIGVKLYQGDNTLADFVVGGMGSDYASTYVAKPEDKNSYSINLSLRGVFDQTDWRDSTIFKSDREKITKLRFQFPNREFTIEKQGEEWKGTVPVKFDVSKEKMDEMLSTMSNLSASSIPEQKFEGTDLEKNLMIVQATGDGVDNTLMVGKKKGEEYFAKNSKSDNIYLISESQYDSLNKKYQDLK